VKRIDYRQNKLIQTKAASRGGGKEGHPFPQAGAQPQAPLPGAAKGGALLGLVSDLLMATKIAQAAKHNHLGVHNFDRAGALVEHAASKRPFLVILDWDGCEAEAFKVLKAFREDAVLKGIPTVGYVSQSKKEVKEEAERAGCHRVYTKVEFTHAVDDILMRYAL
jgi:PleD family two-component response regulator